MLFTPFLDLWLLSVRSAVQHHHGNFGAFRATKVHRSPRTECTSHVHTVGATKCIDSSTYIPTYGQRNWVDIHTYVQAYIHTKCRRAYSHTAKYMSIRTSEWIHTYVRMHKPSPQNTHQLSKHVWRNKELYLTRTAEIVCLRCHGSLAEALPNHCHLVTNRFQWLWTPSACSNIFLRIYKSKTASGADAQISYLDEAYVKFDTLRYVHFHKQCKKHWVCTYYIPDKQHVQYVCMRHAYILYMCKATAWHPKAQ